MTDNQASNAFTSTEKVIGAVASAAMLGGLLAGMWPVTAVSSLALMTTFVTYFLRQEKRGTGR